MATDQGYGTNSPEPFAYFDPDSCSWKMCQGSLLEDSGESCTTWPRQGTWGRGFVWELATSEPPTDESASSSLLPTPSAYESTPTDEYSDEVREHLMDTHKRLYLPGRKWHSQRTLSRMAGALLPTPVVSDGRGLTDGDSRDGGPSLREVESLLPTPGAWLGRRPENATADPERAASREHEGTRGKRSLELPDALAQLLPTPTTQDAANTAGPSQQERNTPPLNAVAPTLLPTPVRGDADGSRSSKGSARPDEMGLAGTVKMLPTPQASDGSGGPLRDEETLRTGKRPSGQPATVTLVTAARQLLPTPVANPDNPGAGGELRAAIEHGPGRRNETGIDSQGRPNMGRPSRLLPTPTGQDANQNALNEVEAQRNPNTMWATMGRVQSGDHTSPRFGAGKPSSADPHPDQLTLEDA